MDITVDTLHDWATWSMIPVGILSFVSLFFQVAPYGRYSAGGAWGPLINAKIAWMLWEMPALAIPAILLWTSGVDSLITNLLSKRTLLATCFMTHYFYRAVIYPMMTRGGKPAPLSVAFLGGMFCVWNGFVQGWYITRYVPLDAPISMSTAVGALIWLWGWLNVVRADTTLIGLRKPGETGYKIPRGGLFELVSAANYFAEIVEWSGYALAAGSLPALSFAVFTFCNVGPRGWRHHKWYLQKFEDYPKHRHAVIPYIW
ncbi:hypothetical protein CEUSTIGMA_g2242.t1 [Chlamydomonas eustigma]|uniref:Steroid 5-alpha-reductase DET2 n=1 Tax=Chlamydomonas eustigma TaxID=1157962 RepID=A0A250WVG5_9CHLO|nr:hypothetical protein CEUSTIGMA_g2242.t1 [Chlamydomonas eustigma]|eukprot:GAX74795.1 hypothetical protein CEUSTIGMA_g2242.t1 [Chlamydomonas eustigma]